MAAQTPTNQMTRHVMGDLVARFATLSTVADADTLTIAGIGNIKDVIITPSATAGATNDPCASWSGNVITFHSGGTWSGVVMILSREG